MNAVLYADPQRLFTERHASYARFIRLVRYPQGVRSFFLRSSLLRSDLKILDAGCGTGVITLAMYDALVRRQLPPAILHAFDLTTTMLNRFHAALDKRGIEIVQTHQADVVDMSSLPAPWAGYDLIVSASMLEYVRRPRLWEALARLRQRLSDDGQLVIFITRRNWLTRPLIGRWWQCNLYEKEELTEALRRAGFSHATFSAFPLAARHLAAWGYVIEAQKSIYPVRFSSPCGRSKAASNSYETCANLL